jgi:hypothetical protein
VPEPSERITVPGDLITVGDLELNELHERALASFNEIRDKGPGNYNEQDLAYAFQLRDDLNRIKSELSAREVRAQTQAALAKSTAERQMAELDESINGPAEGTPAAAAASARTELDRDEALAAAAARGTMTALVKVLGERRGGLDMSGATERMVASLGATAAVAPKPPVPAESLVVTASGNGQELPSLEALTQEFINKAGNIPATALGREAPRHKVASIRNTFAHTVDDRTGPFVVQEIMEAMRGEKIDALTAGGGWCAPNEIRYDFFNIADAPSGMLDLPTVGVTRGGLQWPVSPAIGDVFFQAGGSNPASGFGSFAFTFANTSDPWLWSEADDQATVTGSVNKPTLRVPCSTFTSGRLEAYGLTLTAGNLTDSAYPEQTANFLRLLRAAYAHAINARLLSLVDSASTAYSGLGAANMPAFQTVLDSVEFAAIDYRNKYAMSEDSVLEVILPRWVLAAMRADLAWRNNVERESISDGVIRGFFTDRNVSVQFVSDYGVRGSGQFGFNVTTLVKWPATANMLIYAAGTFLHGQGMSLDLGVVRDSVLNAENDFTAAWAEETHMIAKVGHESRKYVITFGVNGSGSLGQTVGSQL